MLTIVHIGVQHQAATARGAPPVDDENDPPDVDVTLQHLHPNHKGHVACPVSFNHCIDEMAPT